MKQHDTESDLEYVTRIVEEAPAVYLDGAVSDEISEAKGDIPWKRYFDLEAVIRLLPPTSAGYKKLSRELERLKKKHQKSLSSQRKKLLKEWDA